MEFIESYWLLIALALAVAVLIAWYVFHAARRTRVTGDRRDVLDEGAERAARNQALIDAPAAAAPAVPLPPATPAGMAGMGEAVEAAAQRQRADAAADDVGGSGVAGAAPPPPTVAAADGEFTRLKGVGPKLAAQLGALGVTGLAQMAGWSEADIDRIDGQLGRFQGRIRRDAWVDQARLLSAGDEAGYAARFGNIP